MRTKLAIAAMLGGTLLLAGCKQQHQEPPAQNEAAEAPTPVAPPPPPPPVEKPKPVAAPKPKPLPATPEDQQVLDDADATGMTARVDRSGNASDTKAATNQEQ
jgi:outer membrane biosynthesis protein TonB